METGSHSNVKRTLEPHALGAHERPTASFRSEQRD